MDANPVPVDYRVDYLFLLVGANPLPNYVAAKLLLNPGGKLILVHSGEGAGTAKIAERLRDRLADPSSHNIPTEQMVVVEEADAFNIHKKVSEVAASLSGTVGLNYTGGTKTMAVQTYRALASRPGKTVFSYLDARTLSIRIEACQGQPPRTVPVGLAVQPTIRELVALHGEQLRRERQSDREELPSKREVLPELAAALAQACARPGGLRAWQWWRREELLPRTKDGDNWLDEDSLLEVSLPFPESGELAGPIKAMRAAFGVSDGPEFSLEQARIRAGLGERREMCRWLDAFWLEHYVLGCVRQVAPATQVHDYGMTLDTDPDIAEHDFEMDVAAMRGYQLFAISCSTSDRRDLNKLKLFEAVVRARQLGGDEAHVGLVTCYNEPGSLQAQVERQWQSQGRVKVFGHRDLPGLARGLAKWFMQG